MEQPELKEILEQHRLWIESNFVQGKCADLEGARLEGARLEGADLYYANLKGANLECANLNDANLKGADLGDANLNCASLYRANLRGANLANASLYGANLRGANLEYVKLSDAILPDISWIIPGCLVQLNQIKYDFYLEKDKKYDNFVQDSFGFFIQDNPIEKTFDMLIEDRIIRNIPHWVKYSGLKQIESESV